MKSSKKSASIENPLDIEFDESVQPDDARFNSIRDLCDLDGVLGHVKIPGSKTLRVIFDANGKIQSLEILLPVDQSRGTPLEQIAEFEKNTSEDDDEERARVAALFNSGDFRWSWEDVDKYCLTRDPDSVLYQTVAYDYVQARMREFSLESPPGFRRALETTIEVSDASDLKAMFYKQSTIDWLLNLSKACTDDYHLRLGEFFVDASNYAEDNRLSRIFQYFLNAAALEKRSISSGATGPYRIASFQVSKEPFGQTFSLDFTTRSILGDTDFMPYPFDVSEVQFGTTQHTKHSGIFQSSALFRTITVFANDGSQFTRYEKMGETESEINSLRRSGQAKIEELAFMYPVTTGDNQVSASGRQVSVGMGWWF